MEPYKVQLVETLFIVVAYLTLRYLGGRSIERVTTKFQYSRTRMKIAKKLVNVLLIFVTLGSIVLVWGVEQSKILYFVSSLLTVLGVALFAQWSILSNITSTLIVFFSFPAKIGDTIVVLDKDSPVEGRISDISLFFVLVKTEKGEVISIPSNLFIQRMIKRKDPATP